jgi:hypothetical protein
MARRFCTPAGHDVNRFIRIKRWNCRRPRKTLIRMPFPVIRRARFWPSRFVFRIIVTMKPTMIGAACALLLAACASVPRPAAGPSPTASTAAQAAAEVPTAWFSDGDPADELDSLAVWPTEDGGAWLVVTAKARHQLLVLDARDGKRLRTVGGRGAGPGQFNRPNGIAIYGDLVFVAERDNHRVQALRLPDFAPMGTFGDDVLRAPYGLWIDEKAPGRLELFVTDSYLADVRTLTPPPLPELDRRVKRFRIDIGGDGKPRHATTARSATPARPARCAWSNPSKAIRRMTAC